MIPAFLGSVLSLSKQWLHLELMEQVDQMQTLNIKSNTQIIANNEHKVDARLGRKKATSG